MSKSAITLTPAQWSALSDLRTAHGYTTIRCADAVETLVRDSESSTVRAGAYSMIKALATAGALEYNRVRETVSILSVKIRTQEIPVPSQARPDGEGNSPPVITLAMFIAQLSPPRARAVWEMLELYREQGSNPLPPKLAECVIFRLCHKYRETTSILETPEQVRQLIVQLREYGFLENTEARGAYRITADARELIGVIEEKLNPRPESDGKAARSAQLPEKSG